MPKEVLKWALVRKGVLKTYVNVVEDIYKKNCTSVKNMCEETKDFRT